MIGDEVSGYVVNVPLHPHRPAFAEVVGRIRRVDPHAWIVPPTARHITLLDWLSPMVAYDDAKPTLLRRLYPRYDDALAQACAKTPPFTLSFDTLEVGNGVAYVTCREGGGMHRIRSAFVRETTLLKATKEPPRIVHATLARNIDPAVKAQYPIRPLVQRVSSFRLVHETVWPMIEFRTLKVYDLGCRSDTVRIEPECSLVYSP